MSRTSSRSLRELSTLLAGWGNYPTAHCRLLPVDDVETARAAVVSDDETSWIPRGLGRAYGDSALNAEHGVLGFTRLDRFIAFDDATGVLECESGVSLAEIVRVFLPRGWFLPVTPGTKFITVGGAVAADVHGKNHHRDGSFGNFVESFQLLTASGDVVTCSHAERHELFCATLGGMGLTGCLISVRFRLLRVPSCYMAVDVVRTRDLDETLDYFARTDARYRYSVAWIDALARGKSLGRSVILPANEAGIDALPGGCRSEPHQLPRRRTKSVPCMLPSSTLNRFTVAAFNALYYAVHRGGHKIVDFDSYFYPLDGVRHWNRIYGRRGFVQFQALLPPETSRAGLVALLTAIAESRRASFLGVLKASGDAGEGMLSYLHRGHTLALDFPNTVSDLPPFVRRLEDILLRHGGRLYLAKDALMQPESFRAMYPRLNEFLAVKRRVDPQNHFSSTQSRRLQIT
jgi:decaprenylphospho-beta-D-ribofuranose 2-oxidase